jgi:hypothetical protein
LPSPSLHTTSLLIFNSCNLLRGTPGRCTFSNTHRILITTALIEYLQSHIHPLLEQIRKDGTAAGDETLRHESTASLARLGLRTDTRADARGAGTASRRAVSGSEALATNELLARAVPDVGDTCGVEGRSSSGVGAGLGGGGGSSSGSGGGAGGEAARAGDEAAAGLACLGLSTNAGTDARGTSAAAGSAVSGVEALATNELLSGAVADVGDTCGVEGGSAGGVGASGGCGGCSRSGSSSGGRGSSGGGGGKAAGAGNKAAAGLACLGLSTRARADARGTSAAARGAVSGVKALATDELLARAVAYIGDTCGVEGGSTSGVGASSGGCGGCSRSGGGGGGGSCGGGSCGGGSGSSGACGEDLEVTRGVEDGREIITDDSLKFVRAGNKSKLSTYWLR